MNTSSITMFKVQKLQQEQVILTVSALTVVVTSLFVTALLPQILFKYIYASQQLTTEPALLGMIPNVAFGIGSLYFIYAMLGNMARGMQIKKLMKQLSAGPMSSDDCCKDCGDTCSCDDHGNCSCGNCSTEEMSDMKSTASRKKLAKK